MQKLEKQFHIHCVEGDVGRYVILPASPAHLERLPGLIGRGVAQLLARRVDALIDGEVDALPAHAALACETVLNALVDDRARGSARGEHGGRLPLLEREPKPHLGRVLSRTLVFDHVVAQHLHRLAGLPDIGEGGDGAQLVGALSDVLIHPRHRPATRLNEGERLAGVDRGELLPVADEDELLDTEGEQSLIRAINAARESGAIVILIAHRPSVMQVVDKILVLREGRVA